MLPQFRTSRLLSILLVALAFFASSCSDHIHPSPGSTSEFHSIDNYDGLDVGSTFEVFVRFGRFSDVEIEANDNLHEVIEVRKRNGVLQIGLEPGVSIKNSPILKAFITVPFLNSVDISGASRVVFEDELDNETLDLDVSGASHFDGLIDIDRLNTDISGASDVNVQGSATQTNLDLSGASAFKNFNFETDVLHAEISGASNAKLSVNSIVNIKASGASSLIYDGRAEIKRENISGASTVRRR